jgi:foldase protein PrsA
MKKFSVLAVLLVLLVPALVLAGCGDKVPAGAIAAVGSGVVTQGQFNQTKKELIAQYGGQTGFPKEGSTGFKQFQAYIVNMLVQNEVVKQEAAKMKLAVTSKDMQTQVTQTTQQVGGQTKLDALLKKLSMTKKDLNDQIRAVLLQALLQKKITAGVKVSDAQISAYYNNPTNKAQFVTAATVTARHVLVKTKAAALKVEQLLKANNTDANWTKVAKKYSIDPGSKSVGGSLGSFPKGRMVAAFDKAAFSLKPNTVSVPVKTQYGWHVIEVTKKTAGSTKTLAQSKSLIKQQLLYTAQNNMWSKWLKDTEKKIGIKYAAGYDPDLLTASPSPSASATP